MKDAVAIMFSSKVLGNKKTVSFQGHFVHWECWNLEIHSVDYKAGLKLVASERVQILLPASS